MKKLEFRKLIREEIKNLLKEEKIDINKLSKEQLLDLLIEVINNHYRGAGWKGVKYSESLPDFKVIKQAILNRMR